MDEIGEIIGRASRARGFILVGLLVAFMGLTLFGGQFGIAE